MPMSSGAHANWIGDVVLIPTLALCLGGASSAMAAGPAVSLSPAINHPSSTIKVSGAGFGVNEQVDIYFDTTDEALASTDARGKFSRIPIPVSAAALPGKHWITATGQHSGLSAQKAFTVSTDWSEFHFANGRSGKNPYENVIGAGNVSSLDIAWQATT